MSSDVQRLFTKLPYQEYICISSQRLHSFLDPSSSRVIQPNDRGSNCHGLVHNLSTEHLNVFERSEIKQEEPMTTHKYTHIH